MQARICLCLSSSLKWKGLCASGHFCSAVAHLAHRQTQGSWVSLDGDIRGGSLRIQTSSVPSHMWHCGVSITSAHSSESCIQNNSHNESLCWWIYYLCNIIYSSSCHSNHLWLAFFSLTQNKTFWRMSVLMKAYNEHPSTIKIQKEQTL